MAGSGVDPVSDPSGLRLVPIAANRPGNVELDGETHPTITAALTAARPGSVVRLGRGRYTGATESFPLHVPAGVTLTGPQPPKIPDEAKKFLPTPPPAELVTDGCVVVCDADNATVANLTLTNRRPGEGATLRTLDARDVTLEACHINGGVRIDHTQGVAIAWATIENGTVVCTDSMDVRITGGAVVGTHGVDPLVAVTSCTDVRIEATAITAAATGLTARDCTGLLVGGCAVLADRDAVLVTDSRDVTVSGNRLRADRTVALVGCAAGEIAANGIERADTAITLIACEDVVVGRNHIAAARIDIVRTDQPPPEA